MTPAGLEAPYDASTSAWPCERVAASPEPPTVALLTSQRRLPRHSLPRLPFLIPSQRHVPRPWTQELAAIARYAPRKGAQPVLVALWPSIRCFWMATLPFADEINSFEWGPTPSGSEGIDGGALPSTAQLHAADSLIDAMELSAPSARLLDDGDDEDDAALCCPSLEPKTVYNPKLQRYYQCIHSRALASLASSSSTASNLPPPDARVVRPLQPNVAWFPPSDGARLTSATTALDAFASALPLSAAAAHGKRSRGTNGASAAQLGDDGPTTKRLCGDDHGAGGAGAGSAAGMALALLPPDNVPEKVDSGDPKGTFWRMLESEVSDLTVPALVSMGEVIGRFLDSAADGDDEYAQRAYRCVHEMRRGALQYLAPEIFNQFMRDLKAKYAPPGSKQHVWRRLLDDPQLRGGLITRREEETSDVDDAAARAFWSAEAAAEPQLPAVVQQAAAPADDDWEDELD